jgi:hypothetical protein
MSGLTHETSSVNPAITRSERRMERHGEAQDTACDYDSGNCERVGCLGREGSVRISEDNDFAETVIERITPMAPDHGAKRIIVETSTNPARCRMLIRIR